MIVVLLLRSLKILFTLDRYGLMVKIYTKASSKYKFVLFIASQLTLHQSRELNLFTVRFHLLILNLFEVRTSHFAYSLQIITCLLL